MKSSYIFDNPRNNFNEIENLLLIELNKIDFSSRISLTALEEIKLIIEALNSVIPIFKIDIRHIDKAEMLMLNHKIYERDNRISIKLTEFLADFKEYIIEHNLASATIDKSQIEFLFENDTTEKTIRWIRIDPESKKPIDNKLITTKENSGKKIVSCYKWLLNNLFKMITKAIEECKEDDLVAKVKQAFRDLKDKKKGNKTRINLF